MLYLWWESDYMKKEKKIEWYNNPTVITWGLIGIIVLIILSSQSFSTTSDVNALRIFQNILNHNITYMVMLVYFILLHTKFGKKYFDYSSIFIVLFFFIIFITSILTLLQSFSLVSLLVLANNFLLLIYFLHTFIRGTRFWREFKLNKSPFNELGNDWYFNTIMVISITLFAVSLISITDVNGTFLAAFDCIYVILLARYIYLYGVYLDSIKKNSKNSGNFDEYREKISEVTEEVISKASKLIDDSKLDEKIDEIKDKAIDVSEEIKDKTKKKVDEIKEEVKEKTSKKGE